MNSCKRFPGICPSLPQKIKQTEQWHDSCRRNISFAGFGMFGNMEE
jgi:hypothetical protein